MIFKFLRYFFHRYLLLSPVYQTFVTFIFSLVISYFPYFKFVTFKTRVILCYTLRKEGRAFRNIGKYIPILCNQPCLFSCINSVCCFRLFDSLIIYESVILKLQHPAGIQQFEFPYLVDFPTPRAKSRV